MELSGWCSTCGTSGEGVISAWRGSGRVSHMDGTFSVAGGGSQAGRTVLKHIAAVMFRTA